MSDRGRHARSSGLGFYRDVVFLIGGILVVGAVVFGGLSLWAGGDGGEPTSTTEAGDPLSTTTTTSTIPGLTSTIAPSTTAPATSVSTSPPTTLRSARPPGEVRVVVLNSIGVAGLAAGLSDELASIGYQMAQPDNYTPELSDSMVFHAEGFSLEALELADAVPDGTVASNQELAETWGTDIVVVIGRSYQG